MGLSEQLRGWERYNGGGYTKSFQQTNQAGTKTVFVRSAESPGEWYVVTKDLITNEVLFETPPDHENCFKSLMTALHYAEQQLK